MIWLSLKYGPTPIVGIPLGLTTWGSGCRRGALLLPLGLQTRQECSCKKVFDQDTFRAKPPGKFALLYFFKSRVNEVRSLHLDAITVWHLGWFHGTNVIFTLDVRRKPPSWENERRTDALNFLAVYFAVSSGRWHGRFYSRLHSYVSSKSWSRKVAAELGIQNWT